MSALRNALMQPGYTSPIRKMMQTRQFQMGEAKNALARQQAQLGMRATRQNMLANQQAMDFAANAETRAQEMHDHQLAERNFEQITIWDKDNNPWPGLFDKDTGLYHKDPSTTGVTPKQLEAAGASLTAPKEIKGKQVNALVPGVEGIVSLIENEKGQLVTPDTREFVAGAIKAPHGTFETDQPGTSDSFLKKEQELAIQAESNLRGLQSGIGNLLGLIDQSDDAIGGVTGQGISAINSFVQQVKAVTGAVDRAPIFNEGGKANREVVDVEGLSRENASWLRKAAQETDRVSSAALELAFLHARYLNAGGKISDADVNYARSIVEGGGDRTSRKNKLMDLAFRAQKEYEAQRQTRLGGNTPRYQQAAQFWREVPLPNYMQGYNAPVPGQQAPEPVLSIEEEAEIDSFLENL